MRARRLVRCFAGAALAVGLFMSAGCGQSEASLRKQIEEHPDRVALDIAKGFRKSAGGVVSEDRALCVGQRLVSDLEPDHLVALGFDRLQVTAMSQQQQVAFLDVLIDCVGRDGVTAVISQEVRENPDRARRSLVSGLTRGAGGLLTRTAATCVADRLISDDDSTLLVDLMVAGIRQDNDARAVDDLRDIVDDCR